MSITRTRVDWADFSRNPIKGVCKGGCEYCYAINMYKRFKWDPAIRLDLSVFDDLDSAKAGSRIFLCSTHDMFGQWIEYSWIKNIIECINDYPDLTFIILTKDPTKAWRHPLPQNVWLGVTVESQEKVWRLNDLLRPEIRAGKKFVSFEPLHSKIDCSFINHQTDEKIDWYIIGAETGNRKGKTMPQTEWIDHLFIRHADTPVFLKDNLRPYFPGKLLQEYPACDSPPARSPRGKEVC